MMEYPIKFKAAVLEENKKPLVFRQITFEGPLQTGQLLVKLQYTGICGKQIEEIEGKGGHDPYIPHLLGHEGVGEVVDIGPGVKKVKVGETVVLHWMKGSGIHSDTPVYTHDNKRINAGWVTTFNEYAVVSENRVTGIPADSNMQSASLFGCAVTTGVGVIFNDTEILPHQSLVVYGCGGVGLFVVQAAGILSPKQIIAIDINDDALSLAKEFGAKHTINASKQDPVEQVKMLTDGKGAEWVIIVTGNKMAMENAIETASVPGECIQVGVPVVGEKIAIDGYSLMHQRNLSGSMGGSTFPDRDIPTYMHLNNTGKIDAQKLITKILPFERINEGIDFVKGNGPGRIIIKF